MKEPVSNKVTNVYTMTCISIGYSEFFYYLFHNIFSMSKELL